MDKKEETGIYAALQTITMEIKIITRRDNFIEWMKQEGLTEDNGWTLENAYEIDIEVYNQFCIL